MDAVFGECTDQPVGAADVDCGCRDDDTRDAHLVDLSNDLARVSEQGERRLTGFAFDDVFDESVEDVSQAWIALSFTNSGKSIICPLSIIPIFKELK